MHKHVCKTVDPNITKRNDILRDIKNMNTKFIDNGNTINIGVIYHVCYNGYDKSSVDDDINYVNNVLNKDFNQQADNFNNGSNIYKYNPPKLRLYKLLPYRKRYRYIRITRRIRRRRRLYRKYLRINRRRKRINKRIDLINRRRRRINVRRKKLNNKKIKENRKYDIIDKRVATYSKLYHDYVNRAGSVNVQFNHVQTIYKPLQNISSDNLNTLDQILKINGSPAIDPTKYLNIWIANLDSGILGYAQFPWELKDKPLTDGVVVSRYAFGKNPSYSNYNLNKTIVHEIGHWMGLYHTFQYTFNDQQGIFDNNNDNIISNGEKTGDLINDTPLQNSPTYGNPYKNKASWPLTQYGGQTYYHMYMNYMDYTDDRNMFMFTKEQSSKIRLMLNHYRSSLVS